MQSDISRIIRSDTQYRRVTIISVDLSSNTAEGRDSKGGLTHIDLSIGAAGFSQSIAIKEEWFVIRFSPNLWALFSKVNSTKLDHLELTSIGLNSHDAIDTQLLNLSGTLSTLTETKNFSPALDLNYKAIYLMADYLSYPFLSEDFEDRKDGDLIGTDISYGTNTDPLGRWIVMRGKFYVKNYNGSLVGTSKWPDGTNSDVFRVVNPQVFTDMDFSVICTRGTTPIESYDGLSIFMRYKDANNLYVASIRKDNTLTLLRKANETKNIEGISRASNIVIVKITGHGFSNGNQVTIVGVADNTYNAINGATITYIDEDHFSYGSVGVDGSSNGGTATGGVYTILKQVDFPNSNGVSYHFRGRCAGSNLQIFVDGIKYIDTSDSIFSSGKVGIKSGADSGSNCESYWDNIVCTSLPGAIATQTIKDYSGNSNNFSKVANNNPVEAAGGLSKCQVFNGSGILFAPSSNSLSFPGVFTISFPLKLDAAIEGQPEVYTILIEKGTDPYTRNYSIGLEKGNSTMSFTAGNGSAQLFLTSFNASSYLDDLWWHWVDCVWDDLYAKIYIDNVERGSSTPTGSPVTNTSDLTIGGREASPYYHLVGRIGALIMSSTARTADYRTRQYTEFLNVDQNRLLRVLEG